MVRTLRAYRRNPIDPAAAQEMLDYVSRESGSLLVEFELASGSKMRVIAKPVGASREKEGRRFLTVSDIRTPSGQTLERWAGQVYDIDLTKIRTLGYVGPEEADEAINEAKYQYRFLSPDYRRDFTAEDGKRYSTLRDLLNAVAVNKKYIESGELQPGETPSFAMIRPGWFTPGTKGSAPSETAINDVLKAVKARFDDPVMKRMLVATGNRKFSLPADGDGSFLGVDMNSILSSVRDIAVDGGVQPTGQLLPRVALPELPTAARFGSAEEKKFLKESRAAYEEARQLFEKKMQSRGEGEFGFVDIDTRDIRIDRPQPYSALIYVSTIERDRTADALRSLPLPFQVKIIDEPTNPLAVTSIADSVAQWILAHPEWEVIAVAHGVPQPTTAAFIAALKEKVSDPVTLDIVKARMEQAAFNPDGDLVLPLSGRLVGVTPRATDYSLTFERNPGDVVILDQNADLLLKCAGVAGILNNETVKLFSPMFALTQSMLQITGLAPVVPIRPDVTVPAAAAPAAVEVPKEADITDIGDEEVIAEAFAGVSPLEGPSIVPLPGKASLADPAAVTEKEEDIALPERPLTEKMANSRFVFVQERLLQAMFAVKANSRTILLEAMKGNEANRRLRDTSYNLLERAKIYVRSVKLAGEVIARTIEMMKALRKLMMQVRDITRDHLEQQRRDGSSASFNARETVFGCDLVIGKLNELMSKQAVTSAMDTVQRTLQNKISPDLRSENDLQVLRGLKSFAPTLTKEGYYDLSGEERRLVVREVVTVPKSNPPVNYVLGQEYEMGDIIQLGGERKTERKRTVTTDIAGTGFLILRQEYPLNVAPIRADYIKFDKRLISRQSLAAEYNEGLAPLFRQFMAMAWNAQWELDEESKKQFVGMVSAKLDRAVEKDPESTNYVRAAEEHRKAHMVELRDEVLKNEELTPDQIEQASKEILKRTKFEGANVVGEPVLYVLVIDEQTGSVYYPQDMNLAVWAQEVMKFGGEGDEETLQKIERSPRFMSEYPVEPGALDFMRRAAKPEAEAVIKILLPLGRRHAATPLRWRPARYRMSKQMSADVKDVKESVEALRHLNAGLAARSGASQRPSGRGTVTVRRGGETPGAGLEGTLGGGTVTGKGTLAAGSAFRVQMRRAKPGETVGDFYVQSDPGRLRRYLQELASGMSSGAGFSGMDRKALMGRMAGILEPYRTFDRFGEKITWKEAKEAFKREYPRVTGLYDQLSDLDADTLARLKDEGGTFVDATGATQDVTSDEVEAALKAVKDMADLEAIDTELARRDAETIEKSWQRMEKRADPYTRFTLKYKRLPTEEESNRIWEAVQGGIDPLTLDFETKSNPMKRPMKNARHLRNPDPDDPFEFSDEDLEQAAAASVPESESMSGRASAAPAPPPPPRTPPPREEREEAPPPPPPRPPASRARAESLRGFRSPLSREVDYSEVRVDNLRRQTAAAWSDFNGALNDSKKTSESLVPLLSAYIDSAAELQDALDERDKRYLEKNGADKLRELLRTEAMTALSMAQAAYTRPPRGADKSPGSKKASTRARLSTALYAANSIDPYGRPLVPPSSERLAQKGLRAVDLATARARDLKDGFIGLPAPMNYAQLVEAAKIASEAEKSKRHGTGIGAISCRVMGEDNGVRHRLDRELIVRLFDRFTYTGGGRRGGVAQPNSGNVDWDKVMLVWLSPDSDHAVIFVRNVGVCEFHSADYPTLLSELIRYIADWFSDPRSAREREGYSVFVGRSGHDRIFQIWGQWPEFEGKAGTVRDNTRPTPVELYNRITDFGIYNAAQDSQELVPLGRRDVPNWLRNLTFYWITDTSAKKSGFNDLADYLTAEAESYRAALGASRYGKPASESYTALREGEIGERAAHVTALMRDVEAAMAGDRVAVTLFYPELYSGSGVNLSANTATPDALFNHLKGVAASVPDGGVIRIVDLSLFRKQTRSEILAAPKVEPVSSARGEVAGVVPTPYAALFKLMKGKPEASIEVVLPDDPETRQMAAEYFLISSNNPVLKGVFIQRPSGLGSLGERGVIAPGSTVILWNDPDLEGTDRQFGRANGVRIAATAMAQYAGFIRRVYIETGSREVEAQMAGDVKGAQARIEAALAQLDSVTAEVVRAIYLEKRPISEVAALFEVEDASGEVKSVKRELLQELLDKGLRELRAIMSRQAEGVPQQFRTVPFVSPTEFRAEMVEAIASQIKAAGSSPELTVAALGIPAAVVKRVVARARITAPKETAEEVLNEIARAYKVEPAEYVRQGGRGTAMSSDNILLNRGARTNTNRRTKIYGTQVRR